MKVSELLANSPPHKFTRLRSVPQDILDSDIPNVAEFVKLYESGFFNDPYDLAAMDQELVKAMPEVIRIKPVKLNLGTIRRVSYTRKPKGN